MADIDSNLPVKDTADGTPGSPVPSIVQQIGGKDGSGNLRAMSVDTSGVVNVLATAQPGIDIGDVTINNAAGASAVNIQDGGNSITVDGVFFQTTQPVSIAATVAVSGPLTDTQLRATPVPVSGTIAATQSGTWTTTVTQATGTNLHTVIDSGTITLPTGASTSALQTTGNSSLSSIDTKTPALGQALMAASTPVVIASNQSAVPVSGTFFQSIQPVSQSGTWNINNISGTISLPTGASTSALQTTGNTSLASIDAGIPTALGSTSSVNSMPVVDVLNTAGQNRAQSVTTTAAEALGAATILTNRKMLSIRPTNGIIYWGFTNTVTTTTGTPIYTNEIMTISATDNLHIYVIAASTIDARISEAS